MEPTKRKTIKHNNERWELDYGLDSEGHRKRSFHETEALADAEIAQYRKDVKTRGEWWARLHETERMEVEVVHKKAKAAGLSLGRLWEDHQRWKSENTQPVKETRSYEEVVREWKKRKLEAGKSQEYVDEAESYVFKKFGAGRMKQDFHTITAVDLGDFRAAQTTWGLSSKRTNTSLFSSLWQVAVDMEWASKNITEKLEPIAPPGRVVKIYPNATVMNIMAGAMEPGLDAIIAPLSLGLFGCMRPEEISEPPEDDSKDPFNWDDIDLKHKRITVRVEVAKPGDQRTIRMQPTAAKWLELAKELKNPLPPINERRLVDAICELIGLEDWIRDGLRKNCATHLRNHYKMDYEVVKDMGNSVRILMKNYADLHTPPEVSDEHWKITPEAVRAYRKTKAWKKVMDDAAVKRASASKKAPSPNGTATRAD
jgi:hypothetical protein